MALRNAFEELATEATLDSVAKETTLAAASAKLDTLAEEATLVALGNAVSKDSTLAAASAKLDGLATETSLAALIAAIATIATEATLASIIKTEDTPAANGDKGVPLLALRFATDAPTTSNDGDYTNLKVDEEGRLKVASKPASYSATVGNITANGQTVFINCERFSNLMIHCKGTFAGANATFEGSLDSTDGTDGTWFGVQAIRSNANTIETTTGVLAAAPVYAWELSVNALKYFRIRLTAFTSGTQTWTFIPGTYATEPIPGAQISGTQPISGSVTVAAGTAAVGDVGVQYRANATGAASRSHLVSAATTNPTVVKASAGRLLGCCLSNTTATWKYVKLHNQTTAPTAGTGVVQTIGIPPNSRAQWNLPGGVAFTTGIALTIVGGSADNDATAVAVGDVVGDVFFA